MNKALFYETFRANLGSLNQYQVNATNFLLTKFENEKRITDVRKLAYVLATVYHETATTMRPIAEYGRGKGRKYGRPVGTYNKSYYGRGYVQLTWDYNYKTFTHKLNVPLYANPDLAMRPEVAYDIMILGMRDGLYTGKRLADYINDTQCDYVSARRIINGTDKARTIAKYATIFEAALSAAMDV